MLSKLFKRKSLDELKAEAEAFHAAGDLGHAKLAYDKLEERAARENPELGKWAAQRVTACCDALAEQRIEDARAMAERGQVDLAREELTHAEQIARSSAMQERIADARRHLEQRDAVERAPEVAALTPEERYALISGAWEQLQAEELDAYGEPLVRAVVALDEGRGEDALALLEQILRQAREPSYLWLEIGRAKLITGDLEGGEQALATFLARIGPEEGGTARLLAHRERMRILHERKDFEGALRELEAAAEALDSDPRAYLDLGSYLRLLGRPSEAVEVLEMCASLFPDDHVEWPVHAELGLAYADAGESQKGIDAFENMLEQLTQRGIHDLPGVPTVRLAKLHENAGNAARAADLYRALTEGQDSANQALYHREAARLLAAIGLADEAQRMADRASALEAAQA
jgi:tetratricopeptide (TPR) repeat protein